MNFESLIRAAAQQFGAGSSGTVTTLLSALMQLFLNDREGGMTGLLDRFRKAGLGDAVSSWMGGRATEALSTADVERGMGPETLSRLGAQAGVSASSILPLLGFLLPKLIGMLTPGGQVPSRASLMAQYDSLKALSPVSSSSAAEGSSGKWIFPALLVGLLLAAILWFFNRGVSGARTVVEETASTAAQSATGATSTLSDAARSAWAALGEFFKRRLPDGIELNIPRLGVENKLIDFIESPSPADKTTWFDFDRLLFDTAKSTLQPDSQDQLQSVAAILKAFPNVHIKLGGYTDNTGDPAANLKLSADRANHVMAELVRLGVDAGRLSAEGYGDQHPVGDNATEEGRARNRRISMRVTQK
ncbi:MAG: OmpA family protein [Bryobacteraceae bacterium]|nr:OmpA family protein [Bryobacteraceae bacterium]